jgi:hypothetical protein
MNTSCDPQFFISRAYDGAGERNVKDGQRIAVEKPTAGLGRHYVLRARQISGTERTKIVHRMRGVSSGTPRLLFAKKNLKKYSCPSTKSRNRSFTENYRAE